MHVLVSVGVVLVVSQRRVHSRGCVLGGVGEGRLIVGDLDALVLVGQGISSSGIRGSGVGSWVGTSWVGGVLVASIRQWGSYIAGSTGGSSNGGGDQAGENKLKGRKEGIDRDTFF